MRKVIRRWFWLWDFDKEEKWLNEMAAKGLAVVAIDYGKYTFEPCTPGEYTVRLEMLDNVPTHAESQQYIQFIEDTGAEYLGSLLRWVYFRKKTSTGSFALYSDNASRIKHLNRLLALLSVLCFVNLVPGFSNLSIYMTNGKTPQLVFACLNLGLFLLLSYGLLQLYLAKRRLQKQQSLFE